MKEGTNVLLKKLTNVGTIVGITSAVIYILQASGYLFDAGRVESIVQAVCSIGMLLGFLNNADSPGLDIPLIPKYSDIKSKKGVK